MPRALLAWTALVAAALLAGAMVVGRATASGPEVQTPPAPAGGTAVPAAPGAPHDGSPELRHPSEKHLANIRQLTFGGENAEAYWSHDGSRIIFQSTHGGLPCDQIFVMNPDGGGAHRVSTGMGKTTCSYFFPDGGRILYASTHLASPACPAPPDYSKGYVWLLYPSFEIFTAAADGSGLRRLTDNPGYDAEATISEDGGTIIFTSMRDGDLDLYTMKPDGAGLKRITREIGYDGGAFFSHDGKRIVWRASRPKTGEELKGYQELLRESAIKPMTLEIMVANADGSGARQVTHNGAANFGPYFAPGDRRIIYASNVGDPAGRNFDLWMVNDDGSGAEQITFDPTFDGFPMFSPDGKRLLFASNRNGKERGETNIFLADWIESPVEPPGR